MSKKENNMARALREKNYYAKNSPVLGLVYIVSILTFGKTICRGG